LLEKMVDIMRVAVHQFFETMCPLTVVDGKVDYEEGTAAAQGKFQLIGVISITGDCKGSASVHLNPDLASKIAKVILGMDEVAESDLHDMVGEFANITVGGAKTVASSKEINFDITCPTVLRGEAGACIEPSRGSKVAMMHFVADEKPFVIMIALLPH